MKATASLSGAVTTAAGIWQMTAVSEGADAWRLSLALGSISIADIVSLVPDVDIAGIWPPALWSLAAAVKPARFELTFSPGGVHRTSLGLVAAIPAIWELLPGKLAVRDTTLALTVVVDPDRWGQVDGALTGTVEVGGHAYQVGIKAGSATGFTVEGLAEGSVVDIKELLTVPARLPLRAAGVHLRGPMGGLERFDIPWSPELLTDLDAVRRPGRDPGRPDRRRSGSSKPSSLPTGPALGEQTSP